METSVTVGRGRRLSFMGITLVLGVFTGLGVNSLVTGWFEGGDRLIHRMHDIGTGIYAAVLLAPAYLLQTRVPDRRIAALQQALLGLAAFVAAMVLAGDFAPEIVISAVVFAVLLGALQVLHPATHRLVHPGRISPPSAVIVALAAVPLIAYALRMAELQREGVATDPHIVEHHWTTMAAMAVGILLIGALAALRTRGWRIPAWCAGLAAVLFGLASVVYPTYAGSAESAWGTAAMAGGVAFIAVAEWEARRAPAPDD
jgi:hypothetical protein